MKHFFKLKTWLMVLVMYLIAVSLSVLIVAWQPGAKLKTAQAGSEDNVSGYAWSENFGWVSFNCTNDNSCGAVNYGVKIDLVSGDFSGYAWSPNSGWISFNRSDSGDPPAQPYQSGATILANYDRGSGLVNGWAKILALGDDGWLKLRKFPTDSGVDYGVSINQATGDFSGWAWNGNNTTGLGLGWLSFNCADSGAGGCASSNYKVVGNITQPPTVSNLTAPNWSYAQASQLGALKAFLKWQFSDPNPGSSESAYQLIFDDDPNPASPLIDTDKCSGYQDPLPSCLIDPVVDNSFPPTNIPLNLNYNQKYYWWVKVWNNYGLASDLKQYDTVPDTDNDDGDPLSFTTYKHEFPLVDFSWTPTQPSRGEKVKFSDASKYYTGASPNSPTDCNPGHCIYLWTVPVGATIDNGSAKNPQITFGSSGQVSVTLKVTDKDDGYYSSLTKTLNLKQSLPSWREVKPR